MRRMTSALAKRLADDLVQVGELLGFQAEKEAPVSVDSTYCTDILWKLPMPQGSPFPTINIAAIEIQYSNSPTSIGHNIFKAEPTVHPAFHVVISYNKLTDEFKKILVATFPIAGLVVLEGEDDVRKLNLWITRFLTMKEEGQALNDTGQSILRLAEQQMEETNEAGVSQIIQDVFENDIKKVFLPPELTSLLAFIIKHENPGANRGLIDDVFASFISYVQKTLEDYRIAYVVIPADSLFKKFNVENDFRDAGIELGNTIEIRVADVYLRDTNGYPLEVGVHNGNAFVESCAGTVCTKPLRATDVVDFVRDASQAVEDQLTGYKISEDDKKKLLAIKDSLEK
jgi:hypothetical protein